MGNNTCQRVLSRDSESLHAKWKEIYNETLGARFFLNKNINELVTSVKSSHLDEKIKEKVLPKAKEEGEYHKAKVAEKLHKIKNLVQSEYLKQNERISDSNLIKHNPISPKYEKVNEFRLEICYLIHTWSAHLSKTIRPETEGEDHLLKILDKFNIDESNDFRNKLMIITFKMFVQEFVGYANEGNETGYKKLLPKLKIIVESMDDDQSELGTDKEAAVLKENFDKICFGLIKILKDKEYFEKSFLQELFAILVKLIFYLGSIRLHILLLTLLHENKKKFSKIKIEIPEKLSDENIASLPSFWVDRDKEPKVFELSENEIGSVKDFNTPNENTIILLGNDHSYLLNNNEKLLFVYDKVPIFKTLNFTNGIKSENCNEIYCLNNEFYALHQNENYTGRLNLNSLTTIFEGGKIDIPYGIESNIDPILREIRDKGWDWSSYDYFFLRHKDKKNAIIPRLLKNNNYDSGKPDSLQYIMIFNYSKKQGSRTHFTNYKQKVVTLGGKAFSDWKTYRESSSNGHLKPGFFGPYIFIRNKVQMVIIHPETAKVVSVMSLNDRDDDKGKKFSALPVSLDGFDYSTGEILNYKPEGSIQIYENEAIISYNLAALKRSEKDQVDAVNEKKEKLKREMGILAKDEEDSEEESIASEDEGDLFAPDEQKEGMEEIESETFDAGKEEFFLSYVDYLTRMVFKNKTRTDRLLERSNNEMKKLMFDVDRVENKQETYEVFFYVLHVLKNPKSDEEAALVMLVLKSLENHLEILSKIQKNKETGIILKQHFLKKLRKKVRKLQITEKVFGIAYKNGINTLKKIEEYIAILVKKNKSYDVVKIVTDMIQNTDTHSYEEFMKELKMLKLSHINRILKKPLDDNTEFLKGIFEVLNKEMNKLMEEEAKILSELVSKKMDYGSKKGFKFYILQKNLVNCINAIIGLGFSEDIFEYFIPGLSSFIKIFDSTLNKAEKNFTETFKEKTLDDETEKSFKILITGFDRFFVKSLIGNFYTMFVTMKEFLGEKLSLDATLTQNFSRIHIRLITFINSLGKWLKWDFSSTENSIKEYSLEVNSSHSETKIDLETSNSFKVFLSTPCGTGLKEYDCVSLFRLSGRRVLNEDNKYSKIEHVFTWTKENFDHEIHGFKGGPLLLVRTQFLEGMPAASKVYVKFENAGNNWRSSLSFVNIAKLCLGNLSSSVSVKPEDNIGNKILRQLGEDQRNKLDKVLGSNLFENGINEEEFKKNDFDLDIADLTEIEIATLYKNNILEVLQLDEEGSQNFEKFISSLQNKIKKKNHLYSYGGKKCDYCVIALFIAVLKHQGRLEFLSSDLSDESSYDSYADTWLKCSKIRITAMKFQTARELKNLFRKIKFLLSMEESQHFMEFPGVSETGLGSLDEEEPKEDMMQESQNPEKEPDWIKLKNYLKKMKEKRANNNFIGFSNEEDVVSIMLSLIRLHVEVDTIMEVLTSRMEHFKAIGNSFAFFLQLLDNCKESILASEIFTSFEKIFRTSPSKLESLTINYNGLPTYLIKQQISLITKIIKNFVQYLCSEENPIEIKLLALKSLKWLYKGRESECILAIDIIKIWETNIPLENNDELMESILELIEVMMNFCVRKIQQQEKHPNEDNLHQSLSLSLKRHVSTVDESSMANILNTNLTILIQEIGKEIEQIDKMEAVEKGKYLEYRKRRSFTGAFKNLASMIVNSYKGRESINIGELDAGSFSLNTEKIIEEKSLFKRRVFRYENKTENGDVQITEEIEFDEVKQDVKNSHLIFDEFDDMIENIKKIKEGYFKRIHLILSILFSAIYKIPDTAVCIFENEKNSKLLFKLALDSYPTHLQTMAINILSELTKKIPFEIYEDYESNLQKLKSNLITTYQKNDPLLSSYANNLKNLILSLFNSHLQHDKISEILKEIAAETSCDLILRIFNSNSRSEFLPGVIVSRKTDVNNLPFILLPKYSIFYKESISNKSIISSLKMYDRDTMNNTDNKKMVYKTWPIYCLFSNSIEVADEENLEVRQRHFDSKKFFDLSSEIGLLELVTKSEDLADKLRMLDIIHEFEISEFYGEVEKLNVDSNPEDGVSVSVTNDIIQGFLSRKRTLPKQESEFKAVDGGKEKFEKLRKRVFNSGMRKKTKETKMVRTNQLLRRSTACLKHIDSRVLLNYNELNIENDKLVETKILKKCIQKIQDKILLKKNSDSVKVIFKAFKEMDQMKEGHEKSSLNTRIEIMLENFKTEEKKLNFIRELTTINEDYSIEDIENEYYRYKLALHVSGSVKNISFFQDFGLQIFDHIISLVTFIQKEGGALDNPYVSLSLVLLCRNFRNFVHFLKKMKSDLDLTEQKKGLEILFNLGFIDDEYTFKIWQEKDCEELDVIFPHMVKTICFHTIYDRAHFEKNEKFNILLKRLDFHKFGYEIAQGDDERAADIYIAGKILSIFDKNDSDIESLKSVIKEVDIQFGTWEATKVDLKGYNYWTWKIPDYTQNAAFRLLKNKNEILCSQYYTSTEWKGPYKSSKFLDIPRIESDQEISLDVKPISDFYLATDDRYYRRLYEISTSNMSKYGNPAKSTNFNISRCQASDRFLIANGRICFYNETVNRNIVIYEGISHGGYRFFYSESSRELLYFDNYFDMRKPESNYRIDNCYYNHNYMFKSIDFSLFPEVQSISSDYRGYSCYVVFKDGNFAIFNRNYDCTPDCYFYSNYLKNQNSEEEYIKMENIRDLGKNTMIMHFSPKARMKFVNASQEYFTVVYDIEENGTSELRIYGGTYVYNVKFPKNFELKHAVALSSGYNLMEVFALTEDGRIFHFYGTENEDSRKVCLKYFETKGEEKFTVEVSKNNDEKKTHDHEMRQVEIKDVKNVVFDALTFSKDNRSIILKYHKPEEEFYRVLGFTTQDSNYFRRIIKDLKFLRLKEEAQLPIDGFSFYCFIINDIETDFSSKMFKEDDNMFRDYRELLENDVENPYDLEYPFMLYYDKVDSKFIAKSIPKEMRQQEEFDLSQMIVVKEEEPKKEEEKKVEITENVEEEKKEEITENVEEEKKEEVAENVEEEKNDEEKKEEITEKTEEENKEGEENQPKEETPVPEPEPVNKTPIAFIITSPSIKNKKIEEIKNFLKEYEEAEEKYYDSELPEEFILPLKTYACFEQDEFKTEEHTTSVTDFFHKQNPENSINLYFKTKPKKILNIEFLKKLGELDKFSQEKITVKFVPDISRMNSEQWEKFKKESEKIWKTTRTEKTFNDDDEEIETEINEFEEGVQNFRKYRDIFVGRMKTSKYPRDTSQISSLFFKPIKNMEEINDGFNFTDDIVRDRAYEYIFGLNWLNHKIWLHYINSPYIEGQFWESDTLGKFKVNSFDTYNASLQRTIEEDTIKLYVNRINGEKSTFEDQDDSLLNQMYYYLWKWARNQKGSFYQVMRYNFEFLGEPGIDAGGLRREYMLLLAKQVLEELKLFVKSPNSIGNLGKERDNYIPNPYAVDEKSMDNFYKLGFVMAAVYTAGEIININLPSIFWKFILNFKITWKDVKLINHNIYTHLEKIKEMPDEDIKFLEDKFVTRDELGMELKPNGRNILLTPENRTEYINLVKEKTMNQFMPAFRKMKEGFYTYVNYTNMRFLSPEKFEQKLCGMDYVDIEVLKRITKYKHFDVKHPAAKRFWRVLEGFNQEQLAGYLKYVWGRTRLSHGCSDNHELVFFGGRNNIPEAHTCFFQLDLGDYETDEELRKKLLYGIENCNEIAEDDGNYNLGAAFGI